METSKNSYSVIWNGLLKFQRAIMIVCSLLIIVGICLQAAFRYLFQINFYGFEEVIVIIAFWLYFMGGAYGSYEESHIKADIVQVYVKNERLKDFLKLLASAITTGLFVLFTFWAFDLFIWGIEKGAKTAALDIPLVIPQSSILLGFILMSFYSIVYLIRDICSFLNLDK